MSIVIFRQCIRLQKDLAFAITMTSLVAGCGVERANLRQDAAASGQESHSDDGTALKKSQNEEVVESLVLSFHTDAAALGAMQLSGTSAGWQIDMEQRKDLTTNVAPQKYLRVTGNLATKSTEDQYEIGCLHIELKDNVNYREKGWLRIATNGISGSQYSEVRVPVYVKQNGWTALPVLDDSVTLGMFEGNTVKKFDGTLCFKIDTRDLPAQDYKGQIIVQYLKSGISTDGDVKDNPVDLAAFRCKAEPVVINAGDSTAVSFNLPSTIGRVTPVLRTIAANNQAVDLPGVLTGSEDAPNTFYYQTDVKVSQSYKAIVEARPDNDVYLPVFCEINVVAKSDIGVGDDGEINGITGNVYKLAANTAKLPDFAAMTPVAHLAVANLDIPDREFSKGFPGVKDLVEWFGVRFRGTIKIPANAKGCKFKVISDDGARVYLDETLVVDNDGLHPPTAKTGQTSYNPGEYQIRVDYYQGPRYRIAMQLFWDLGDGKGFQIIPSSAFARPLK